jgi:hypothetical protein
MMLQRMAVIYLFLYFVLCICFVFDICVALFPCELIISGIMLYIVC